jgi:phosphonate transport system substrate-binding protein
MREAKVDAEVMAKAIYTGGHDATALAVAHKKVAAGAMDEAVYQRMIQEGKLDPKQVRIFYTTPPFFDYVWAARRGLDPQVAESFSSAMMKLSASDPAQKNILDLLGATKYVKAEDANYERLRQAAKDAGLLK